MVAIPNAQRLGDMPSGEPVPEGVYALRLDKAEYKVSKESKTPMAEVTWTIFGPDSQEEFHGRKVFENLMLDGEGRFKTRAALEAAGYDEDFVLEDTEQLVGLEVGAVVQIEKERDVKNAATGETKHYGPKNKVARYLPLAEVE